jgi:soluble lytic murein transglycosylase-like protein
VKIIILIILFTIGLQAREISLIETANGYLKYKKEILHYSLIYDLDYRLVTTIIAYESGFNEKASYGGCNGLMQVKGGSFEVRSNIRGGCSILHKCFNSFPDDTIKAITAYNKGITGAKKAKGIINYTKDVLRAYGALKILLDDNFIRRFYEF